MSDLEEKLLEKKKKIEQAKNDLAKLEGKLSVQMDELKKLGCKSVEEAEALAKKKRSEAEKIDKEFQRKMLDFEQRYGF